MKGATVVPSGVLIGLLLAATPLFALGAYEPMLPLAGLGVMLGALLAASVDARLSRARDALDVTRELPAALSLGVPNTVTIAVYNRSGRPLRLLVKDDPPLEFDTPERLRTLRLDPWQLARVTYRTTPTRRGRLEELGLRAARARGEGTEFESLREYVPDDSFRDIDWKATARRGAPITRQFQAERNQTLLIMIDSGRMMAAHAGGMARVDHAVNAALMLAHVAGRMGDTVGLLVFSDRVKSFVTPAHGAAQTERMLEELYALRAELVEPDFRAAITFLRARARKRAMICAFTDLVDPEISREALSYLASLRPQHLPLVATIADDQVEALADADPARPIEAYEKALAARTLAERELALARLRARGVLVCDARAGELSAAVVGRYLSIKRRGLL